MQFGLSELILFQIAGKGNSWEGGIRVPTVVSWPSHLPQGIEISEPTNSFDIFPTLLEIAGAEPPKDREIDGKTLMPLLTRQTNITSHEIMIHYCAKAIHAVRYRPRTGKTVWKTHFMTPKFTPGTEGCFGMQCVTATVMLSLCMTRLFCLISLMTQVRADQYCLTITDTSQ